MNLSDLSSKNPKIKYACSKAIIKISHETPRALLRYYDFFVELLKSDNSFMKWTAIDALGGIASVTGSAKDVKLLVSYLNAGKMITAGHAMTALAQIALAKSEFKERVINELLKVPKYKYDTAECNRVACSRVIATLEQLGASGKNVKSFLMSQSKSSRPATRKRAERLLNKL